MPYQNDCFYKNYGVVLFIYIYVDAQRTDLFSRAMPIVKCIHSSIHRNKAYYGNCYNDVSYIILKLVSLQRLVYLTSLLTLYFTFRSTRYYIVCK